MSVALICHFFLSFSLSSFLHTSSLDRDRGDAAQVSCSMYNCIQRWPAVYPTPSNAMHYFRPLNMIPLSHNKVEKKGGSSNKTTRIEKKKGENAADFFFGLLKGHLSRLPPVHPSIHPSLVVFSHSRPLVVDTSALSSFPMLAWPLLFLPALDQVVDSINHSVWQSGMRCRYIMTINICVVSTPCSVV